MNNFKITYQKDNGNTYAIRVQASSATEAAKMTDNTVIEVAILDANGIKISNCIFS